MNFVKTVTAPATAQDAAQATAAMLAAREPSLRAAGREALAQATIGQRKSTLLSLEPLSGDRWLGPMLPIVNPPLWELGHVGWFHERWCLRERSGHSLGLLGSSDLPAKSILPDADKLYDSTPIEHHTRWGLPLIQPAPALIYLAAVLDEALIALDKLTDDDPSIYFHRLSLFHEMMHREAFCYTWQTHGYQPPQDLPAQRSLGEPTWLDIAADDVMVGSEPETPFVFDNEKFGHVVAVDAFQMSNQVVSAGEFAQFVLAGGYDRAEFWPDGLLLGKHEMSPHLPRYWRLDGNDIQVRQFEHWSALNPAAPMTHVSMYEAQAYCRWAGVSLPTEAQWLLAARDPRFEWGDVWEWTNSIFDALPGFSADPYKEYSAPWFHTHQVLKGASFSTPLGMCDTRFRNYYEPHRADVFNGFRVVQSMDPIT